jgi:hypothetical protein
MLLVALVGAVAAPALGVDRAVAALGLVAWVGVGSWLAVAVPLWSGWRRAGRHERQALLVERVAPWLEGRLVTAAERLNGPRGAESAAILDRIAGRAVAGADTVRPSRVHPAWPAALAAAPNPILLVAALVVALLAPGGLAGVANYWTSVEDPGAAAGPDGPGAGIDRARVGDLLIEYVYPAYTGLDPLEVPNSTGDVHGPPGTLVRVRARSADPIDAASVVAYGEPTDGAEVSEGRIVSGAFTIGAEDGVWWLDLSAGVRTRRSREFQIAVEPDLPPVVLVDAPPRLEVPVDEPFVLPWAARDDYGLVRVALYVDEAEVREVRVIDTGAAEASGAIRLTPADLGMSPGMRAVLQVGATDNNGWSGAQLGLSTPPVQLVVLEPGGRERLGLEEREALRNVLVDLLARQVTQPWPPGRTNGAVLAFGERFDAMYAPLRGWMETYPQYARDGFVRRLVSLVLVNGNNTTSYAAIQFDGAAAARGVDLDALRRLGDLRDRAIVDVEQAIILIDRYLGREALTRALAEARRLASVGAGLAKAAENGEDLAQLGYHAGRVREVAGELGAFAEQMEDSTLKDLLQRRSAEIDGVRESLDAEIAAGDDDVARKTAGRLARLIDELRDELEYRLKRMDEEDQEMIDQIKELLEALSKIERDQRTLQAEVRVLREAADADGAADAERAWAQVERLAGSAAANGRRMFDRMGGDSRAFYARERVASALRATERFGETVRARDLRRAITDVDEAVGSWLGTARLGDEVARRAAVQDLDQAQRILLQLAARSEATDPETAARVRALASKQAELAEARAAAEATSRQLIPELPIEPIGMLEALESAAAQMEGASAELGDGRAMPAEGAQGQAAEHVREARRALEDVLEGMSGGGGEEGEGGEGGEGEAAASSPLDLDTTASNPPGIDLEDQFDLDEFQRDVLRGMQGDVPESYRALKKRYYEELMTQ